MNLIFKASQKNDPNDTVTSNELRQISIPFKFYIYGYNINGETLSIRKAQEEGVFILPGIQIDKIALLPRPIKEEGYIYVYYEKKIERDESDYEYGAEYKVLSHSDTYNNITYLKLSAKTNKTVTYVGVNSPHINFDENDIVWSAFSQVRWADEFRDKIMSDFDAVKTRFTKLDVSKYIEECKTGMKANFYESPNLYGKWANEDSERKKQKYITSPGLKSSDTLYLYEKKYTTPNYILALPSASIYIQETCHLVEKRFNNFKEYINYITSGIDPSNTKSKVSNADEYQKLVISASLLCKLIVEQKALGNGRAYDIVQFEKFKILLDFEKRVDKKNEIKALQDYIKKLIDSNWFKYEILEYIDNKPDRMQEGQQFLLNLYQLADHDPDIIDSHIYSDTLYRETFSGIHNTQKNVRFKEFVIRNRFHVADWMRDKYDNIETSLLKYKDVDEGQWNMLLLLSNSVITEKDLFGDELGNLTLDDLYNFVAFKTEEKDADSPFLENEVIATVMKTIAYLDSSFWYFTNFFLSSQQYKDLLADTMRLETAIDFEQARIGLIDNVQIPARIRQLELDSDLISLYQRVYATGDEKLMKKIEKDLKNGVNLNRTNSIKRGQTKPSINKRRAEYEKRINSINNPNKRGNISDIRNTVANNLTDDIDQVKTYFGRKKQDILADVGLMERQKNDLEQRKKLVEENSNPTVRKISGSKFWLIFLWSLGTADLVINIRRVSNQNNQIDTAEKVAQATDLMSSISTVLGLIATTVETIKGKDVWGIIFNKPDLFKTISLTTRISIVTSVFQIVSEQGIVSIKIIQGQLLFMPLLPLLWLLLPTYSTVCP